MLEGVDYSDARPGGAHLAATGKRFAVRYLYPSAKGLTAAEVRDLAAHGVALVLVFEGGAGAMRNGHAQGITDAKLAQAQLAGLPLDHRLPIYFAKDYAGGLGVAEASYLAGAASVIGADRVGLYGCFDAVDGAITGKHAAWYWQTYAWSGGKVRAGIHLLQYSNGEWAGSVDFDRALRAEYGQHAPAVPAPKPAPAPTPAPPLPAAPVYEEADVAPILFKGDKSAAVYVLSPATGTKRYVPTHEARVLQAAGLWTVHTIAEADAAAIPAAP